VDPLEIPDQGLRVVGAAVFADEDLVVGAGRVEGLHHARERIRQDRRLVVDRNDERKWGRRQTVSARRRGGT
jgi:hypothetical protein